MLDLAAPLNLWALTGLALPIAIHLWRRRTRHTYQIGSLALLQESQPSRFRSRSLTDVPLFVLRVLLIGVLAFLIGEPFLRLLHLPGGQEGQRWALVDPDLLRDWKQNRDEYALEQHHFEESLRSLQNDGWQLRLFTPDHPPFSLDDDVPETSLRADYWTRLTAADQEVPNSTFFVFAPEVARGLSGNRPKLSSEVHWRLIPARGDQRWIRDATATEQELRMTIGEGSRESTRYRRATYTAQHEVDVVERGLQVTRADDSWSVTIDDAAPVEVQAEPAIQVAILHAPERAEDARYVRAALVALDENGSRPTTVVSGPANFEEEARHQSSVVFWLSPEPPSEEIVAWTKSGGTLICDAEGDKPTVSPNWARYTFAGRVEKLRLWRSVENSFVGFPLWGDGQGEPLLSLRREELGLRLQYNSRFQPSWSELVVHPAFPEAIDWLIGLQHSQHDDREQELRGAAPEQFSAALGPLGRDARNFSLETPLWVLALLLFITERWVAERRRP